MFCFICFARKFVSEKDFLAANFWHVLNTNFEKRLKFQADDAEV